MTRLLLAVRMLRPFGLRPSAGGAVLLLVLLAPAAAHADRPYVDISGADFRPYPLAVAPFAGPLVAAADVQSTLEEDLKLSGLFQILDPRAFLADSKIEGMAAETIAFPKWKAVGAEGLVKAQLVADGKSAKLELKLFDVVKQKEEMKETFQGTPAEGRAFAHRFADALVKHFTGERGVFTTRIAYARRAGANKEIVVADYDGRGAAALVGGGLNLLPAWSPDGASLLFTSYRDGRPRVWVAEVATKKARVFGGRGDLQSGGAFSPDGARVAFTASEDGNSEIWAGAADGSGLQRLTDSPGIDTSPSWSPDGKRIAFVSSRSGAPHLYAMNADGSEVRRLTFQGNYNQTPDWSPRGDLIAFTGRDEKNVFDLFTIAPDTGKVTRLTQDQGTLNEDPSFSPNGRFVLFVSNRGGSPQLWVMSSDGHNPRQVTQEKSAVSGPAWGPWQQ